MVTTILLWLLAAYLGLMVLALAGMLGALGLGRVQSWRSRRRHARSVAARAEQALRRDGFLFGGFTPLEREIMRAAAAADGAAAAWQTPGFRELDADLAAMFPRTNHAPKEGP